MASPRRLNLFVQLRVRSRQDDLALAPLRLNGTDHEKLLARNIKVDGAGDARANGVYARDGRQNNAARWRHVERPWLCILRDGSNWWIGCERAAVEDLYWRDATKDDSEWRVCPCDDSTHRHFRGSGPPPIVTWEEDDDEDEEEGPHHLVTTKSFPVKKKRAPVTFQSDECPICLCALDDDGAARAPCGHLACAQCFARARQAASRGSRDADRELRCPLCRAPFILAAALHVASKKPLLEALPALDNESRERLLSRQSSGLSNTERSTSSDRPTSRLAAFWCFLNRRSETTVRPVNRTNSFRRSASFGRSNPPPPPAAVATTPSSSSSASSSSDHRSLSFSDYLLSRRSL